MTRQLGRQIAPPHPALPRLTTIHQDTPWANWAAINPAINRYAAAIPQWPMMANDTLGCCVPAAGFHGVQAMSTYVGFPQIATDPEVTAAYSTAAGYIQGNPATDNGTNVDEFLGLWATSGFVIGGSYNTLKAAALLDPTSPDQIAFAIDRYCGVMVSVDLPLTAQAQPYVLDVVPSAPAAQQAPLSWGAHEILVLGREPGFYVAVSWGQTYRLTEAFWAAYVVQARALLDPAWLAATSSAGGIAWDSLIASMRQLASP